MKENEIEIQNVEPILPAGTEEFELIEKPKTFKLARPMTRQMIMDMTTGLQSVGELYGEDKDIISAKSLAIIGQTAESKVKDLNAPLPEDEVKALELLVEDFIQTMRSAIEKDHAPNDSYRRRAQLAFLQHVETMANGDFRLMLEADDVYLSYMAGTFNDFPLPLFGKKGQNDGFVRDDEKYEKYMKAYPFLEQYEERQRYEKEHMIPYLKAKKAGTLTEAEERQYVNATMEHLLKEKRYFEKLATLPETDEIMSIYPFAISNNNGFSMDWKGDRFTKKRLAEINAEIAALQHGWSPDDFRMIHQLDAAMKHIRDNKDSFRPGEVEIFETLYQDFKKEYIGTPADRRRMLASLKSLYDRYGAVIDPKMSANSLAEYKRVVKLRPSVVILDEEERLRQETIGKLERAMKGLTAQHRIGTHTDKTEIVKLREKVMEALNALKFDREKSFYKNDKFEQLFNDIQGLAVAYTNAKKTEAHKEPNDKDWRPTTKMGQTRYEAALSLADEMHDLAYRLISGKRKDLANIRAKEKEMREEGYKVLNLDDTKYIYTGMPYEAKVNAVLNYYSKEPTFYTRHEQAKMYSKDVFKSVCTPIYCEGVSDREFSLIALASTFNDDLFSKEVIDKHWPSKHPDVTKEKMLTANRTMFSFDIAIDRANALNNYGEDLIKVCRNHAKTAIDEYKAGDNTKLVNILARSVKGLTNDVLNMNDIRDEHKDFAVKTEVLSNLLQFAKQDAKLYAAMVRSVGHENMKEVEDVVRLKGFLDQCIASEKKLEAAEKSGKSLSTDEKRTCIENIVRYEFVSSIYKNERAMQLSTNTVYQEFSKTDSKIRMGIIKGTCKDRTENDQCVLQAEAEASNRSTVWGVQTHLRTEKGMKRLEETVKSVAASISASDSPEKIRKNLKPLVNEMDRIQKTNAEKKFGLAKEPAAPQQGKKGAVKKTGAGKKSETVVKGNGPKAG